MFFCFVYFVMIFYVEVILRVFVVCFFCVARVRYWRNSGDKTVRWFLFYGVYVLGRIV